MTIGNINFGPGGLPFYKPTGMSQDDAVAMMDKIEKMFSGNGSTVHAEFDGVLCEFLNSHGYKKVVKRYRGHRHVFSF